MKHNEIKLNVYALSVIYNKGAYLRLQQASFKVGKSNRMSKCIVIFFATKNQNVSDLTSDTQLKLKIVNLLTPQKAE